MKIIESQAKEYWCPHGSAIWTNSTKAASGNRTANDQPVTMCIGHKCMAWRWNGLMAHAGSGPSVLGKDCDAKPEDADKLFQPRKGWCGLSGAPR